jgi:hypothetical protein
MPSQHRLHGVQHAGAQQAWSRRRGLLEISLTMAPGGQIPTLAGRYGAASIAVSWSTKRCRSIGS